MTSTSALRRGGDWLIVDTGAADVLTPESLSDEHVLIGRTATEFVAQEVLPALDALETKDWALARRLIGRAGDLGLLGTDVPEEFGGVALDKAASIVVGEAIGAGASFATTFGAQTGLAIIPILCFGTPEQKAKYLPRIVSGELIGAYCLSESGSGSDALGARAKATRQPDGSWTLSGEKMWITNGGFADLFIVFAKVDGDKFTAFVVERGFPGVASGKEEHKMGLLGSSTTPLMLQDARVPAENLLGEIGKGHKIAFNVLNYGRLKLAAMCTGGAKHALGEAAKYAAARRQFGQPIASFGAIRHKLGEMAIRLFASESALYRTAGAIDQRVADGEHDAAANALEALEEFAVEASILKVAASEMLDYVLDENVQIHGGNGFVRDYPAERHYRDARVNRIFEGTNEINRLLVPAMLARRALKLNGGLPLVDAAKQIQASLTDTRATSSPAETGDDALAVAGAMVAAMKKTSVLLLGLAMQTYRETLGNEQEVAMAISDAIAETFLAESAWLRARATSLALQADAAAVFAHDAALRVDAGARMALAAMMTRGDELRTGLAALKRILKIAPVDTIAARRRVADAVVDKGGYWGLAPAAKWN